MDDRQQTTDGVKVIFLEDPRAIARELVRVLDELTSAADVEETPPAGEEGRLTSRTGVR